MRHARITLGVLVAGVLLQGYATTTNEEGDQSWPQQHVTPFTR